MKYCEFCYNLTNLESCMNCESRPLRIPMHDDYCFLCRQESYNADILKSQLMEDNIPFICCPLLNGGGVAYAGEFFRYYKFFVPYCYLEHAREFSNHLQIMDNTVIGYENKIYS